MPAVPDPVAASVPAPAPVRVLFLAALRERVGRAEMTLRLPDGVHTVAGLADAIAHGDPLVAAAFADRRVVRAAVNHRFARPDHPVAPGDEVAFFPPVTGG